MSPRQHQTWKQFLGTALLTSLVVTAGMAISRQFGWLESSELGLYDQFIQMRTAAGQDDRILVVGIDENDIQSRQEYPIEDGTLADALQILDAYNPRAIGVDIGRDVPQGPPEGRERMIDIISNSDRIATACVLSSLDEPGVSAAPGTDPDLIGFADFPIDPDNVVRRSILISAPGEFSLDLGEPHLCNDTDPENEVLSLSLLLSLIYLEGENIFPEQTLWGDLRLGDTVFIPLFEQTGGYASTGATDYQLMLNYRAPSDAVRQVTLTDVLEETVDPAWIEDRIVLIGYTSSIAKDVFSTPYSATTASSRSMPGVVIHAQATSQILGAVLDNRPLIQSWPELAEIAWLWAWAFLGSVVALLHRRLSLFVLLVIGLLVTVWSLCFGLFTLGLWLPLVPTIGSLGLAAVGTRLVDQANQSGYSQAIYEQIKDQLQGTATAGPNVDYLEALVRRARAIRQRRTGEELWDDEALVEVSSDPMHASFDSPEMQTVYEQIKARAYEDWESERTELEADQTQQKIARQEKRIQALIHKAKTARNGNMPTATIFEEGHDG
ncbi:CHASE2 domain-containing protein [Leptothoe spongobia]|uniref:CHASE2 domain-containing protein n=1 Tax=Leptothoe spongobia TAU-MAC 1115 TaxID=1967444 RepID=A0A947DGY2_9CYAN|nr:CHASE2 domain-containing protein [Leptothoe spongobia]MBT9316666.1 CHASE2 domain-containing protein [Leptothoe spongobia TAU-MAC 1115]